jgi:predicted RNA binding protein YcfA (HicA-like mRNA interferase family)
MPKMLSGKQVIKILEKEFGFLFVSQKGSHAKFEKIVSGRKIVTIVPLHRELARGTLHSVLDLAEIDEKEFWKRV